MTHRIAQRHADHAKAIRNLQIQHRIGVGLCIFMAFLLMMLVWAAATPEALAVCSAGVLFFGGLAFALSHVQHEELAAYRQRCNRAMNGYETGYNHALACTQQLNMYRDVDGRMGYLDGYRDGVEDRNQRIRQAVIATRAAAPSFAIARAENDE